VSRRSRFPSAGVWVQAVSSSERRPFSWNGARYGVSGLRSREHFSEAGLGRLENSGLRALRRRTFKQQGGRLGTVSVSHYSREPSPGVLPCASSVMMSASYIDIEVELNHRRGLGRLPPYPRGDYRRSAGTQRRSARRGLSLECRGSSGGLGLKVTLPPCPLRSKGPIPLISSTALR
jgi:hypothetical protein